MVYDMPRVSEQYKDARREQILDAARRCFLRNGFHETSMQDLFAEAGLSSGAVYRYFASKDELIMAIAEANFRDITTMIHTVAEDASGSLGDALADVVELIGTRHAEKGLGSIAVQVWAEALRNPHIAEFFSDGLRRLHDELAAVVNRYQAAGALPAEVSADALSRVLLGTVPGYVVQLTLQGPGVTAETAAALRALWPRPESVTRS
jgi:AcrR family transcriptional regulator